MHKDGNRRVGQKKTIAKSFYNIKMSENIKVAHSTIDFQYFNIQILRIENIIQIIGILYGSEPRPLKNTDDSKFSGFRKKKCCERLIDQ